MLYDLLNLVQGYLDGLVATQDIETWLTSRLQPIIRSADPATVQLADNIDADLIEYGEGLIDEDTLKERWRRYLDRVRIRVLISSTFTNVYEGGMTTSVNRRFLIDTGALTAQYPVPEANQTESRAKDPGPTRPNHYVNEKGVAMRGDAA
jgi:hypothetical protein